jgi:hypothetical protein
MWFKGASQFYANGRIPKEMRENSVIFAENESFTQVHSYIHTCIFVFFLNFNSVIQNLLTFFYKKQLQFYMCLKTKLCFREL